jgi:hypothetical protein
MHQPRVSQRSIDPAEPVHLVTIGWYWTSLDAWMARNRLVAEGIDAFVQDEFIATTYWAYANAVGCVKVQVPHDQAARAIDVLDAGPTDIFRLVPVAPRDDEQPLCSRCGSPELYHEPYEVRLVFLLWLLAGVPIPIPSSAVECYDCRWRKGSPTSFRLPISAGRILIILLAAAVVGIVWAARYAWFQRAAEHALWPR